MEVDEIPLDRDSWRYRHLSHPQWLAMKDYFTEKLRMKEDDAATLCDELGRYMDMVME